MQFLGKLFFILFLFFGYTSQLKAESIAITALDSAFTLSDVVEQNGFAVEELECVAQPTGHKQSMVEQKYKSAFQENRRFTAAMLTFALGMLGVHRLYLGTKPWIPAVYLLTFGGGFLILPLIDLGVILFCKDISKYEHNDKVLMWVK